MNRTSEFAGLLAGLALFIGTLIAAQAYMPLENAQTAALVETLD